MDYTVVWFKRDLAGQLRACGAPLHLAVGEVPDVLARLPALQPFARLVSHEETGNGHTCARDRAVARWCRQQGIAWQEWPQHGVVRPRHWGWTRMTRPSASAATAPPRRR